MTDVIVDLKTTEIYIEGGFIEIFRSSPDWPSQDFLPNDYFQFENSCYDSEKELYSVLQMDMYNERGVPLYYFVVDYNTSRDGVFGEDTDRYIERDFDCMAYYNLPHEDYEQSLFGMYELDKFHVYISIEHFAWASTYHNGEPYKYSSVVPKVGDLFKADYNGRFYEVLQVKAQEGQFMQTQHSYDLICRLAKNQSFGVKDEVTRKDAVNQELQKDDILKHNSDLDSSKGRFLYNE